MKLDVKGAIAILVVVGSFGLIAPYVYTGRAPDHDVLLFVSAALMLVLGFFFGHVNGTQTTLANSAVQLATQALAQQPSAVALTVPGAVGSRPQVGSP